MTLHFIKNTICVDVYRDGGDVQSCFPSFEGCLQIKKIQREIVKYAHLAYMPACD